MKVFDYKSSKVFRIRAYSEEDALRWGNELARWYVNQLFDTGEEEWSPGWYSTWIEHSPEPYLLGIVEKRPIVDEGDYPEYEEIDKSFWAKD